MRKGLIALATLAVAAAPSAARDPDRIPAATPSGKAIDCLTTIDVRESRVRSDQVIDFVMRSGRVYRNTLPNACPSLGFEERFSYRISTTRLCSVDIITVINGPDLTPGASCGLGQFQPVTLAEKRR